MHRGCVRRLCLRAVDRAHAVARADIVIETLLPVYLACMTVLGMWLAGNHDVRAWWLGIANQAVWLWFDYRVEAWGLMPLALILSAVYARNIRKWGAA